MLKFGKIQFQYQDQQCISGIENLIISKFNSQKSSATLKMKWNAVITESSLFQYGTNNVYIIHIIHIFNPLNSN